MRLLIAFVLALFAAVTTLHCAKADEQTVAYLKGAAYGIATYCHDLPLNRGAVIRTHTMPGLRVGSTSDFNSGKTYTAGLLNSGTGTCQTVCSARPGICHFVKQGK